MQPKTDTGGTPTWGDVETEHPTWADLEAANPTYADLEAGADDDHDTEEKNR